MNGRIKNLPRNLVAIGLMLAASGLSSPGGAQSPPAAAQPLSRLGFIATMDAEYRKLDVNKDNVVNRSDVEAQQQRLAVSAAAARARVFVAKFDTDRNGQLSVDEFARANVVAPKPAHTTDIMKRLDANRDGKVSLAEYRALTLLNFDRLDVDKDGSVSVAEQRASGYAR